jgi:hypothetical protein
MGLQMKKTVISEHKLADIMFCIDNSGSMEDCIDGVRNTVNSFVASLEAGVQGMSPVDWQIGLLSYSEKTFNFVNLANNTSKFKKELEHYINGNEFTPGAIDYAISHTSWRTGAQRIIVVFTNEILETGVPADESAKGFDKLINKIVDSHIQIIYYGPNCRYYSQFNKCPKGEVNVVRGFSGISFGDLMNRLAVTISSGNAFSGKDSVVKDMVYDLSRITINQK